MAFQNLKYDLDVCIFGSSRPKLIPFMWESFNRMVIFRGKKRILWNEDFVFPNESKKSVEIINKYNVNLYCRNPKIGLGKSMDEIFKHVKSKYIFYLQEDWIFERPIDLDQILWVMDENPKINCIFFHKINITGSVNKIPQTEFIYSGLPMCIYPGWAFLPGIWRMDKVRKHWKSSEHRPEGFFGNQLGTNEQKSNIEYLKKNIGCYIYGRQGDFRYVRHTGNDCRMASWRLENGKPGGRHDTQTMDYKYMAPWTNYIEIKK